MWRRNQKVALQYKIFICLHKSKWAVLVKLVFFLGCRELGTTCECHACATRRMPALFWLDSFSSFPLSFHVGLIVVCATTRWTEKRMWFLDHWSKTALSNKLAPVTFTTIGSGLLKQQRHLPSLKSYVMICASTFWVLVPRWFVRQRRYSVGYATEIQVILDKVQACIGLQELHMQSLDS